MRRKKIKNPCRAPQWSKATLKKKAEYREANKEKYAENARVICTKLQKTANKEEQKSFQQREWQIWIM